MKFEIGDRVRLKWMEVKNVQLKSGKVLYLTSDNVLYSADELIAIDDTMSKNNLKQLRDGEMAIVVNVEEIDSFIERWNAYCPDSLFTPCNPYQSSKNLGKKFNFTNDVTFYAEVDCGTKLPALHCTEAIPRSKYGYFSYYACGDMVKSKYGSEIVEIMFDGNTLKYRFDGSKKFFEEEDLELVTDVEFKLNISKYINDVCTSNIKSFKLTSGRTIELLTCGKFDKGTLFITRDIIAISRMNEAGTAKGGYEASDLRKWMNKELIKLFSTEIRENMMPFANGDLLRLPTEKEIFGFNKIGNEEVESVQQFESMKDKYNRIAFNGNYTDWYWLSNVSKDYSSTYFAFVSYYGDAYSINASISLGVRPLFFLKN